jgi:hypothetical protein
LKLSVEGSASEDGHRSVATESQGQHTKNDSQRKTAKQTHERLLRGPDIMTQEGVQNSQVKRPFDRIVRQV